MALDPKSPEYQAIREHLIHRAFRVLRRGGSQIEVRDETEYEILKAEMKGKDHYKGLSVKKAWET